MTDPNAYMLAKNIAEITRSAEPQVVRDQHPEFVSVKAGWWALGIVAVAVPKGHACRY